MIDILALIKRIQNKDNNETFDPSTDSLEALQAQIAAVTHVITTPAGAVAANWQAAETNLIIIGAHAVNNRLHLLSVGIENLVGNISIRIYMNVNGVERRIYPIPATTTFSVASDAPAIPVINSTMVVHEAVRVTIQSDNVADNGASVDYDYVLEAA